MNTVTCIVSKLLQVMYCKYCSVYCKLSFCKKKKKINVNVMRYFVLLAINNSERVIQQEHAYGASKSRL